MPFIPRTTREAAIQDAAEVAGKFLDGLKKTDLAKLSFDEWMEFISQIAIEYDRSYEARDEIHEDAATATIGDWNGQGGPKPDQRPPGPNWHSHRQFDLDDEIPF